MPSTEAIGPSKRFVKRHGVPVTLETMLVSVDEASDWNDSTTEARSVETVCVLGGQTEATTDRTELEATTGGNRTLHIPADALEQTTDTGEPFPLHDADKPQPTRVLVDEYAHAGTSKSDSDIVSRATKSYEIIAWARGAGVLTITGKRVEIPDA